MDTTYSPLLSDEEKADAGEASTAAAPWPSLRARVRDGLLAVEAVFLIVLTVLYLRGGPHARGDPPDSCTAANAMHHGQLLYSPAQEAVEYEVRQWHGGLDNPSIYQRAPSPEVDQAWLDLYNDFGVSQIPKWQAELLPNPSVPFLDNSDYYIVELSMFHQMHCLNLIRRALHPDYYIDPVTGNLDIITADQLAMHVSHCVDSLRQGIMCSADISPIVWKRKGNKSAEIEFDVLHTCRKYDKLVEWAKTHVSEYDLDP